jgi:hypothetical protein
MSTKAALEANDIDECKRMIEFGFKIHYKVIFYFCENSDLDYLKHIQQVRKRDFSDIYLAQHYAKELITKDKDCVDYLINNGLKEYSFDYKSDGSYTVNFTQITV